MLDFLLDHFGAVITVLVAIAVAFLVCVAVSSGRNHDRLLAQCLADGRKEYECEALLRSNDNSADFASGLAIGIAAGSR